jgi:hypothetical protein
MSKERSEQFSDEEARQRFEAALKGAMSTPHKLLKKKRKAKKKAKKGAR